MNKYLNYLSLFFENKKEVVYIRDEKSYLDVTNELKKNTLIAIDTEFTWRKTYYPSLSLIQISNQNKIFIFDIYQKNNFFELSEIFKSNKVLKVFHSLRSDISVLKSSLEMEVINVFDTQIAQSFLENDFSKQISYKDLVKKYFFKSISKHETNSDWNKRPLKYNQIEYAANDVRYLIKIMQLQMTKLKKLKLLEEFNNLCVKEKTLGEEDFSFARLKRLKKKNKKISKLDESIFLWREEEAKKRNIPPNDIFKVNNLSRLKELIQKKNFNECSWIIRDESSRQRFISNFK